MPTAQLAANIQGSTSSWATASPLGPEGKGLFVPTAQNTDRTEQRIALIDLFDAMWNTQNISGVLDCFTEDAVVSIVCPQHRSSVVYRGQQQIRDFVEQTIGGCVIRGRSHHVVGDRVIWMVTVANDDLRQMGVGAVRNRNEAVIREGKIVAHTVTMTPEAVATLDAATGRSVEYLAHLGA